jgi:ribosome-binding factor A
MSYRKEKLEAQIKRLISELIIKEIKDPRIGFVSLTGVSLSDDKKSAKVGISVIGSNKERRNAFEGLKSATGFIQYRIGKVIKLRNTPKIIFFLDNSISEGVDMVDFLENLVKENDPGNDEEK